MKTGKVKFRDMTLREVKKRQNNVNSVILFDDTDGDGDGIEFQKTESCDGESALCIQSDKFEDPIFLCGSQIKLLMDFLDEAFGRLSTKDAGS